MPCYDRDSELKDELRSEVSQLKKQNKKLDAALCAVLSELSSGSYDINFTQFLETAESNGQCEIINIWSEHQKEDQMRIMKKVQSMFSEHELNLLKTYLIDRLV